MIVRKGIVFLIECPYNSHDKVASSLSFDLAIQLQQNIGMPNFKIKPGGGGTFEGYVNELRCGVCGVGKIPDGTIEFFRPENYRMPKRISPIIVFEVSFRNESYVDLLIEGSSWINRHTDSIFSFLIKLKENTAASNIVEMELIVLERVYSMKTQTLGDPPIICRFWDCNREKKAKELSREDLEMVLDSRILHGQVVTRETLSNGEEVVFDLPLIRLNYYVGAPIFPSSFARLDFTSSFKELFRYIDDLVYNGTYPN